MGADQSRLRQVLVIPAYHCGAPATEIVQTHKYKVFRELDIDRSDCNTGGLCAVLRALAAAEREAVSHKLDGTPAQSDMARYLVTHKKFQKLTLERALLDDLYDTQDNEFLGDENVVRNSMAVVALAPDGAYLGHVYVWSPAKGQLQMVGIRSSLYARMHGISKVSYTLLSGLCTFANRAGMDTLSIPDGPIGAMEHVARKLGFSEDKHTVLISKLCVQNHFPVVRLLELGCLAWSRRNMELDEEESKNDLLAPLSPAARSVVVWYYNAQLRTRVPDEPTVQNVTAVIHVLYEHEGFQFNAPIPQRIVKRFNDRSLKSTDKAKQGLVNVWTRCSIK